MGRRHFVVTARAESVLRGSPYRADCPTRRILDRIGDQEAYDRKSASS